MAPRSKVSAKSDVQKCVRCGWTLHVTDAGKHDAECVASLDPVSPAAKNGRSDDSFSLSTSRLNVSASPSCYGFLHSDGSLWAALKKPAKSNLDLPPHPKQGDLVLLHPATMTICQMGIGDRVHVSMVDAGDVGVVCTAWPSETVAQFGVVLADETKKILGVVKQRSERRIRVSSLTDCVDEAERIVMKLLTSKKKGIVKSAAFVNFVRRDVSGRCLAVGSKLPVKYFGQEITFVVAEINSHEKDHQLEASLVKLTLDFENLDLPPSDCTKAGATCSTPKNDNASNSNLADKALCPCRQPVAAGEGFFFVSGGTKLEILAADDEEEIEEKQVPSVTCADLGGVDDKITELRDLVGIPLTRADALRAMGVAPPRGIIVYGPTGTGKTMLVDAVLGETRCHVIKVKGSDLWSKFLGDSETKLGEIFQMAVTCAPSVVVLDNLDSICAKKEKAESDRRLLACLIEKIDELEGSGGKVLLLGVTNRLEGIDPSLRRQGRFDREVEIPVPSPDARLDILRVLLRGARHNMEEKGMKEIAYSTHGYVGADLAALCQKAALATLNRASQKSGADLEATCLQFEDIKSAMKDYHPSAMKEVTIQVPNVKWDDIGGQHDLKKKLKQAVEWPLKHPEAFFRMGISPPRGLLMYGPPGCSKTMIAKALANESGLNFLSVKGPELFDKFVGESERAVRDIFRRARAAAPAIIFFDEIEALAVERGGKGGKGGGGGVGDRVLAQMLTEMDGVQQLDGVTVIAATNRPDLVDKALLRPGRMDRLLYVPLPDAATRRDIFQLRFSKMPLDAATVDLEALVRQTSGYSGAEIVAVAHEAALASLAENIEAAKICGRHFEEALESVKPQVGQDLVKFYENYHETREILP